MEFNSDSAHSQTESLGSLNAAEFLVLAIACAEKMNWHIAQVFKDGFIAHVRVTAEAIAAEVQVKLTAENVTVTSKAASEQAGDWGKHKDNCLDLLAAVNLAAADANKDELQEKYAALVEKQPDINSLPDADEPEEPRRSFAEKVTHFFTWFKPTEGYFVTPILINLNLLVFVIMVLTGVDAFSPDGEELLAWGANFRPSTLSGEYWRLLTSCFIHIGIFHLVMNMYALVYIGVLLEPLLGKTRFTVAYLATGICASVTSLWWHNLSVGAGASGAIFGMYGVFLAMLSTRLIEKTTRQALLGSIGIFVAYNLLYGMKGNIDNAAHIGGLISGVLVGYIIYPGLLHRENRQYEKISIAVVLAIALTSVVLAGMFLENTYAIYDEKIAKVSAMEGRALKLLEEPLPAGLPEIEEFEKRGVALWDSCGLLTKEISELDLDEGNQLRVISISKYIKLRKLNHQLITQNLRDSSATLLIRIDSCNKAIDDIITALNTTK